MAAAATPFATHMRHGFVLPASTAWGDWLPLLSIGEAGVRVGDQIKNDPTKLGWIAHGPFKYLEEGRYLVSMEIEILADHPNRPQNEPCVVVEVVAGLRTPGCLFVQALAIRNHGPQVHFCGIAVMLPTDIAGIETRIDVLGQIGIVVRALMVEPASASISTDGKVAAALTISDLLRIDNWLPFLRLGPLGRMDLIGRER